MTSLSKGASQQRHVVIVGGGFAGLECALTLAGDPGLRITLLDRNNFHVFQPLLYQVGTGILAPSNAAFNLRALLAKCTNVTVQMSDIERIDLGTKTAYGRMGDHYTGDYLVIAVGAQANFFDTPGASAEAYPLYSLQDAERLRSRLMAICESAETSEQGLPNGLNIVVVGGGATGVEVAGALGDLVRRTPKTLYKKCNLARSTISLVDPGQTVLGPFRARSQKYAVQMLQRRGIAFYFGLHVSEVTQDNVLLSNGERVASQVTIWAGGIKAAGLAAALGIPPGKGGRVDVDSEFRVPGCTNVFALGDCANFTGADGKALPQLASVAKQAGRLCAKNILADYNDRPLKPFQYTDKGIMAMIGRNAAVAEVGKERVVVLGPMAFLAWVGVHVLLLDSLWVMIQAVFEWISDYFGKVSLAAILDRDETQK